MIHLQEHDIIPGVKTQSERYENLSLVSWDKPMDGYSWGYRGSGSDRSFAVAVCVLIFLEG